MKKMEIGDSVKIGDKNYSKIDGGVNRQKAIVEEKNFMRDGIVAKIAILETHLAELQAILAEIGDA